jgi:hypothetical protein
MLAGSNEDPAADWLKGNCQQPTQLGQTLVLAYSMSQSRKAAIGMQAHSGAPAAAMPSTSMKIKSKPTVISAQIRFSTPEFRTGLPRR